MIIEIIIAVILGVVMGILLGKFLEVYNKKKIMINAIKIKTNSRR